MTGIRKRSLAARLGRVALGLALLGAAAACGFIPGTGPPPDIYTLTPKSTFDPNLPGVAWQLVVEEPQAAAGINTTRIALSKSPTRIAYFASARWSARAPQMVQTLLVESFENTQKIVAVGREAIGLRSDFNLRTDLREFQAEYYDAGAAPRVRVRLNAKIVRQPRRDIIASRTFEEIITADGAGMNDIVVAFDDALGKVLKHVVEWTLLNAR